MVVGHGLIALEAITLDHFLVAFYVDKRVAVDLLSTLIPIEFLGKKFLPDGVADIHITFQPPELLVFVENGGIAVYCSLRSHFHVECLHMQSVGETPRRLLGFVEHIPKWRGDLVARYAGIGNQGVDIDSRHGRGSLRIGRSRDHLLILFLTAHKGRSSGNSHHDGHGKDPHGRATGCRRLSVGFT